MSCEVLELALHETPLCQASLLGSIVSPFMCISFVIFRKLQHPGIVKYFGTCLLHETIGTTVKIVLELCDC